METNSAIVMIKPHAIEEGVEELLREKFGSCRISIVQDAYISAEVISDKRLVDKHYGAIGSKAVLEKPADLVLPEQSKADFLQLFGITWERALESDLVLNAADAAATLELTPLEVSEKWEQLKVGVDMIKIGGGFYVGQVDFFFVVNGFYAKMRAKYTTPGTCVRCFEVEWDPETLPWKRFRADVIGSTNPMDAADGSIRNSIYKHWEKLGLSAEPDIGDNGVHASASPFAGLVEKANWLGVQMEQDAFGKAMINAGISRDLIKSWAEGTPVPIDGKKQSVFDILEDLDAAPCLLKAGEIAGVIA